MCWGGWVLALWGVLVEVTGPGSCPTPPEVAALLHQLAPGLAEGEVRLRAELLELPDALEIRLATADGREVARRQLTGSASCAERAAAVSVMLLTWARELEADGALEGATPPQLPPEDLARSERPAPRPLPEPGPPVFADVTVGLSASVGGRQVALGGLLAGGLTSGRTRVGGHVTLAALGARYAVVEQATYERFALAITPHYRAVLRYSTVDFHAGPAASLFAVIPEVGTGRAWLEPGVTGGVRVLGTGALWAGLQAYYWPLARPLTGGERAPRAEVVAAAGLSWSAP